MSTAEAFVSPPDREVWTKEKAKELEDVGWKSIAGLEAFWLNKANIQSRQVRATIESTQFNEVEKVVLNRGVIPTTYYSLGAQLRVGENLRHIVTGGTKKKDLEKSIQILKDRTATSSE